MMSENEIKRRVGFLYSPVADALVKASEMLTLASAGMQGDDPEQAEQWRQFGNAVVVAASALRDRVLADIRQSDSGIVLAQPNGVQT